MSRIKLYQKHLDRVSRSFAHSISRLETPLRKWVSLTYLTCRILDTVEDARWKKLSEQMHHFDEFDQLLEGSIPIARANHWQTSFPKDLPDGERDLLADSEVIFSDINSLPDQIKKRIQVLVASMSAGMRYFAGRKVNGILKLDGLKEVNQYCFFVAGVVGETLANLLEAVDSKVKVNPDLVMQAHHFGLFLQKVNLLKDQFKDEKEGRFLIPSRQDVFASLQPNAIGAYQYIISIPANQKSYRVFCLWSLYLGLLTLPLLRDQTENDLEPKISRHEAMEIFSEIEKYAHDNAWIEKTFSDFMTLSGLDILGKKPLDSKTEGHLVEIPPASAWFKKAYKGILGEQELNALGV